MEAGGFEDVRVETVARAIEWESADGYWMALGAANPWFPPLPREGRARDVKRA